MQTNYHGCRRKSFLIIYLSESAIFLEASSKTLTKETFSVIINIYKGAWCSLV